MSDRERGSLGGHVGLPLGAKSKHEVAALLCAAAAEVGLWSVPEFEIEGADGNRRHIDVVWAVRDRVAPGRLWTPVAAFEIEGHGVARARASIRKNADSLTVAGNAGAKILAMVLFQVGPGGTLWSPKGSVEVAERFLQEELLKRGVTLSPEVILDEKLDQRLPEWLSVVRGA